MDQEALKRVRSFAESLPKSDREVFIANFQKIQGDPEKVATLVGRLPDTSKEPTLKGDIPGIAFQAASGLAGGVPTMIRDKPRTFATAGLPGTAFNVLGGNEGIQNPITDNSAVEAMRNFVTPKTKAGKTYATAAELAAGLVPMSKVFGAAEGVKAPFARAKRGVNPTRDEFVTDTVKRVFDRKGFFGDQFAGEISKIKPNGRTINYIDEVDELVNRATGNPRLTRTIRSAANRSRNKLLMKLADKIEGKSLPKKGVIDMGPDELANAFENVSLQDSQDMMRALKDSPEVKAGFNKMRQGKVADFTPEDFDVLDFHNSLRKKQLSSFSELEGINQQYAKQIEDYNLIKRDMSSKVNAERFLLESDSFDKSSLKAGALKRMLPPDEFITGQTAYDPFKAVSQARAARQFMDFMQSGAGKLAGAATIGIPSYLAMRKLAENFSSQDSGSGNN